MKALGDFRVGRPEQFGELFHELLLQAGQPIGNLANELEVLDPGMLARRTRKQASQGKGAPHAPLTLIGEQDFRAHRSIGEIEGALIETEGRSHRTARELHAAVRIAPDRDVITPGKGDRSPGTTKTLFGARTRKRLGDRHAVLQKKQERCLPAEFGSLACLMTRPVEQKSALCNPCESGIYSLGDIETLPIDRGEDVENQPPLKALGRRSIAAKCQPDDTVPVKRRVFLILALRTVRQGVDFESTPLSPFRNPRKSVPVRANFKRRADVHGNKDCAISSLTKTDKVSVEYAAGEARDDASHMVGGSPTREASTCRRSGTTPVITYPGQGPQLFYYFPRRGNGVVNRGCAVLAAQRLGACAVAAAQAMLFSSHEYLN